MRPGSFLPPQSTELERSSPSTISVRELATTRRLPHLAQSGMWIAIPQTPSSWLQLKQERVLLTGGAFLLLPFIPPFGNAAPLLRITPVIMPALRNRPCE